LLTLAPVFTASASGDFQNEISLDYFRGDDDSDLEWTLYGATYTRYFLPIKFDTGPYAEAAFLEQVGDLSFAAAQGRLKFPGSVDVNATFYIVGYDFAMPDTPWIVNLAYENDKTHDASLGIDISSDAALLDVGRYYGYGKLVGIRYVYSDTTTEVSNAPQFDTEENDFALFIKNVYVNNEGFSTNLEAVIGTININDSGNKTTNTDYSIGGDLYLTKAASIGASASINTGEDPTDEGQTYDVRFVMYFTAVSSLELGYEKFVAANSATDDYRQTSFSIGARF